MQYKIVTGLLCLASAIMCATEIKMDGKLNEAQWQNAVEYTDFQTFKGDNANVPMPKTSFKVVSDADNIYLGVYCQEPQMAKLKSPKQEFPWGADLIEIFLSPSCRQDEFYQFVVSAGNVRWCEYYAEGGNIRPDPGYAPLWNSEIYHGKDFWSVEIRIPLAGFYHTRNEHWRTTWLVNVTRDRKAEKASSRTWSPLISQNRESSRYRKLAGFPMRNAKADIFIDNVTSDITGFDGKTYFGQLILSIYSAEEGMRMLTGISGKQTVKLTNGRNFVKMPGTFKTGNGRQTVRFVFDSDNTAGREYPVLLKYEPIAIRLTTPGYSNTFYPGQNRKTVEGTIRLKKLGSLTLVFEGEGITRQTRTISNAGVETKFSFDSAKIGNAGATLTAKTKEYTSQVSIQAPAPTKSRMVWIENGYIMINGKPVIVRMIEGIGFNTGRLFNKLFEQERASFCINNDLVTRVNLEPNRLLRGIESEAVLDIKPSQKLRDLIKKKIVAWQGKDFTYYYLCDEPECRNISPVYLRHLYEYIKSLDPFHPVMICSREAGRFADCADYLTAHPYWSPYFDGRGSRLTTVSLDSIPNYFKNWQAPNKASGIVPQVFSYRNLWNRMADYPTLDEIECCVWSAIASGVTGVETYHYHDLGDRGVTYDGTRFIMQSLERLDAFLLTPDKKQLISPAKTIAAIFTCGKGKLLILINASSKPVQIQAPFRNMPEFRGSRTFNGTLTLKPLETALFTSAQMDQGLESRAAVAARITQKEKQRLASKSIFFEKGFQINIDATGYNQFGGSEWTHSKLFDGVKNMLAWTYPGNEGAWLEFEFPQFVPEFTCLVIHGSNLGKMVVNYWKDGAWKNLADQAAVMRKEYDVEYRCKTNIRTVKLRIELPKSDQSFELYEMEAFNDGKGATVSSVPGQTSENESADNVLWRQDGKNLVTGAKGWKVKENLKVFATPQGMLTISGVDRGPNNPPATNINIPVSREYPWFVFKLDSVKFNPGSYRAWGVQGPATGGYFQDISPIPGIYTINMNEKGVFPNKGSFIAIYAYNEELTFSEISIVKKTECMLSVLFDKNEVLITATLAKPAESISVRICHEFHYLTKGLELKPADSKRLVWNGSFKLEKPLQYKKKTAFTPGQLVLRADILGGNITVPVFAKIFREYPPK